MPEIHVDFYVDFFLTSNYKNYSLRRKRLFDWVPMRTTGSATARPWPIASRTTWPAALRRMACPTSSHYQHWCALRGSRFGPFRGTRVEPFRGTVEPFRVTMVEPFRGTWLGAFRGTWLGPFRGTWLDNFEVPSQKKSRHRVKNNKASSTKNTSPESWRIRFVWFS